MKEYQLLIVEDMLDQVNLLLAWLNESSIQIKCHIASSMKDAIDIMSHVEMDAILLDLGLLDSEGFDTLRGIRHVAPDTPIVVITGTVNEKELIHEVDAGNITDYVIKPPNEVRLVIAVTVALLSSIEIKTVETCTRTGTINYVHKDLQTLQTLRSLVEPLIEVK
jgi:DNA-binding response OmpR family regulator